MFIKFGDSPKEFLRAAIDVFMNLNITECSVETAPVLLRFENALPYVVQKQHHEVGGWQILAFQPNYVLACQGRCHVFLRNQKDLHLSTTT